MKKIIFTVAFIASGLMASAQVGVGTENPQTSLHIVGANSTDKGTTGTNAPGALAVTDGITVPVVTDNMLTTPTAGTKISQLVYSTNVASTGYYFWNGTAWTAIGGGAIASIPTWRDDAGTALNVNIVASDANNYVRLTGANLNTVTLPAPTAAMQGKIFNVCETAGSTAAAFQTAGGVYKTTALPNANPLSCFQFVTDGTDWYCIGAN